MIRASVIAATGTALSRMLGFVRDILFATILGAGPLADAFLAAFQIINVIRRFLGEGALNAALVPAYLRRIREGDETSAAAWAGKILATLSLALFLAALALGVVMPWVIGALAPGFAGTPRLDQSVMFARLMLPYLAFAGPVSVLAALLNARHRVAMTSFMPAMFNVLLIGVLGATMMAPFNEEPIGRIIAATIGLAGFMQLLAITLHWRLSDRAARPLRVAFDDDTRGFLKQAAPALIAGALPQLTILIGAIVVSPIAGAVAWLYYANRLIELPLGIASVALGAAALPQLTLAAQAHDDDAFAARFARARDLALGLALPASIGLIVLADWIVQVLFEHGAFLTKDSAATTSALICLALGLPGHVLAKTLAAAAFAQGRTRAPMVASLIALVAALLLSWGFQARFGLNAVALALASAGWIAAAILWHTMASRHLRHSGSFKTLAALVAASLLMGVALVAARHMIAGHMATAHHLAAAIILGALIAGGIALYGGTLLVLGIRPHRASHIPGPASPLPPPGTDD